MKTKHGQPAIAAEH